MSGLDASKVQELMHRLQSLDVDLQEAARARLMTEADYTTRLKRLRRAIGDARKLREAASAQTMPTPMPSHFDLPVMSGYSRIEQKIVARFVTDTKNYTNELSAKLQRVSGWSLEAVHDVIGWIKVIWRLSWIRREMRRLEQDIDRVRKARGVVEDFISRSEIGGLEPNPKTNQRDLLAAFTEFEVATGKVTAMRAKLRSEIARNEDMKNWLSMYKVARQQNNPEKTPPEASDVQALGSVLADHLVGGAKLANDRLVVARRLAYSLDGSLDGNACGDDSLETKSISEGDSKRYTQNNPRDFQKKKNRHAHKGARI
jgi:hypothetical protein